MEKEQFNEIFRQRTKALSVRIIRMYANLPKTDELHELQIVCKQLIRSSTSVAANYRAACRARSKADFFAKMSFVVEEADETLFWLELLEETEMIQAVKLAGGKKETLELLSVFSKARHNIK